jgi:DNA repair protein RadA/Sms
VLGAAIGATRGARGLGENDPVAVALSEVDLEGADPIATGVEELDRVLGGGLVPGSVTLVGGEPGVGKSTLMLECIASAARRGTTSLLVSAEESAQQVRRRSDRLGATTEGVHIIPTTDLGALLEAVVAVLPGILVVDSIQTIADAAVGSAAGTTVQVRECASSLVRLAKSTGIAVLLVGHLTKDGSLAGPRALEHVVDTVLSFEGERHHSLRLLAATKHRFGATGELGVFEMGERGLKGVADPSGYLIGDRRPGIAGSVVVPIAEGRRPLLVELQALVTESALGTARRSVQGLPAGRLALLLAVVEQRLGVSLGRQDVFASVVGGVRVQEPAIDLALGLAIGSAASTVPVPEGTVAFGEVGLGGEVRQVGQTSRRLAECARLGFRRAVVAASSPDGPAGIELVRVRTLSEALEKALTLTPPTPIRRGRTGDGHFAPIIACPDGPSDAPDATVESARSPVPITGLRGRSRRRVER